MRKITSLLLLYILCAGSFQASPRNEGGEEFLADRIVNYGLRYLSTPYRHGASGPSHFDCSGFTSHVYGHFGFALPHSSAAQAQFVQQALTKNQLAKGDMVFFEGSRHNGRVGHVGIVSAIKQDGSFDFLHASTQNGVIISGSEEAYYAERFLHGGRLLAPEQINLPQTEHSVRKSQVEYHSVQSGETLSSIARKYNISVQELMEKNNITANDPLPLFYLLRIDNEGDPSEETEEEFEEELISEDRQPEYSTETPEVSSSVTHRVERGETLYSISRNYGLSVEQLRELNQLTDNTISIGQLLLIKHGKERNESLSEVRKQHFEPLEHRTGAGETLYGIARRYNCSVDALKRYNNKYDNSLKAGELLRIPPQH